MTGFRFETRDKIKYHTVETVVPPTLRSNENPLSNGEQPESLPPINQPDISPSTDVSTGVVPSLFEPTQNEMRALRPQLFTQEDFDNLVRDANLSRKSAEVVASRLKQRNLVTGDFRITAARKRGNTAMFDECFKQMLIFYLIASDIHILQTNGGCYLWFDSQPESRIVTYW